MQEQILLKKSSGTHISANSYFSQSFIIFELLCINSSEKALIAIRESQCIKKLHYASNAECLKNLLCFIFSRVKKAN